MKCSNCSAETKSRVFEVNICKEIPLCDKCKSDFGKCIICGENWYKQDLKIGMCHNCMESEEE